MADTIDIINRSKGESERYFSRLLSRICATKWEAEVLILANSEGLRTDNGNPVLVFPENYLESNMMGLSQIKCKFLTITHDSFLKDILIIVEH